MSELKSDLLLDLQRRGCIANYSNLDKLDALLASGKIITVYAGFDPTANDLHAGHLLSLTMLRRFMVAGHRVVPVIGTATAMVGDPSGKTSARPLLDSEVMRMNADGIWQAIALGMGDVPNGLIAPAIIENGDWFEKINWLSFLRDVGSLVSVNRILGFTSVMQRLAPAGNGMSFLEFSYSLMQGYDFLHLHQRFGDLVQIGGSDQWGNICMGLDIIVKTPFASISPIDNQTPQAFGLTHPLLENKDGEKVGKYAGNAIWLSPDNLSDFEFFQFWRNIDDYITLRTALCLSDRSVDQLKDMASSNINVLKECLAIEMTTRIRGIDAANQSLEASRGKGKVAVGLAEFNVTMDDLSDLITIIVKTGLIESKGQARRLAVQNGLKVNGQPHDGASLSLNDFQDGLATVSMGKTHHVALRLID